MAGIQIVDATATDRTITGFQAIDATGTDRTITQGRVIGPDGVDRVFYDPSGAASFTATASPTAINGSGTGTITSSTTTVSLTGGTAPYTHSWVVTAYSNDTAPTVTSPAGATTALTQTNMPAGGFETATIVDTVTDSSTPANTTTVSVNAIFHDTSEL